MRLMVRSPLFASGQVIGVGVDKLQWLAPVRPGDRLRARAEILGHAAFRVAPGPWLHERPLHDPARRRAGGDPGLDGARAASRGVSAG